MTMTTEYDEIHFQDETNALGLIDFSSENDVLFLDASSDSSVLQPSQPLEQWKEFSDFDLMGSTSMDAGKEEVMVGSSDQVEKFPDLIKSPEPERATRKGKCNMRKSLAWDNAFFTNAGVLDPEELSSMINGTEKSEKKPLPQIVEDVRESADSISTLGSDTLTMDNLEVGFFQDIRASIQKSAPKQVDHVTKNQVKPKTALKKPNTIPKVLPKQNIQPQVDHVTKSQVKPKAVLKKPNTIPKALPKQNIQPQMPMKDMKQDSQITKDAARSRVLTTTTTKATRIISSRNPIPTATGKRDSLSAAGIKGEKDKPRIGASAAKGAVALKVPASSGARRVLPKLASSSKSSLSSSMMKSELSRLSSNSSGSLPPVHATISPLKAARRKLDNRLVRSPSDSTLRTTSRTVLRDRTSTSNSALPACLMSFRKSSSMSPSSSISERSSASSTSASGTNQRSNKSRASFDTSSCKSLDSDNLPLNLDHNSDQRFDGHEDGGLAIHSQLTKECSTLTGTLSHPAYAKPSGLRRPSPSIGFFDGTKTVMTPKGSMQRGGVPLPLAKVGAAARCPNQEIGMKPNTKKPNPTPLPEVTSQYPDNISTDFKGSCATSFHEDLGTSGQGNEVARDAEIRPTHSECDENLKPSEQDDKFAKVAENELKVCSSALSQCNQNENSGLEKQAVESTGQGNEVARDAEIRPTHSECDENLKPSGQDDKFAKVAENELKVCSSALSQCNQNENSGLEKQAVESTGQGNEVARDAEIRPTHSECDENLKPSGQDDKFAKVAENELKVCSSALSQCNQNENSGLEKQAVESSTDVGFASSNICQLCEHSDEQEAAPIFPPKTSNNCRDPLAEIKVACSGSFQDNFSEPSP